VQEAGPVGKTPSRSTSPLPRIDEVDRFYAICAIGSGRPSRGGDPRFVEVITYCRGRRIDERGSQLSMLPRKWLQRHHRGPSRRRLCAVRVLQRRGRHWTRRFQTFTRRLRSCRRGRATCFPLCSEGEKCHKGNKGGGDDPGKLRSWARRRRSVPCRCAMPRLWGLVRTRGAMVNAGGRESRGQACIFARMDVGVLRPLCQTITSRQAWSQGIP